MKNWTWIWTVKLIVFQNQIQLLTIFVTTELENLNIEFYLQLVKILKLDFFNERNVVIK